MQSRVPCAVIARNISAMIEKELDDGLLACSNGPIKRFGKIIARIELGLSLNEESYYFGIASFNGDIQRCQMVIGAVLDVLKRTIHIVSGAQIDWRTRFDEGHRYEFVTL